MDRVVYEINIDNCRAACTPHTHNKINPNVANYLFNLYGYTVAFKTIPNHVTIFPSNHHNAISPTKNPILKTLLTNK